jgi:hypothetical protein
VEGGLFESDRLAACAAVQIGASKIDVLVIKIRVNPAVEANMTRGIIYPRWFPPLIPVTIPVIVERRSLVVITRSVGASHDSAHIWVTCCGRQQEGNKMEVVSRQLSGSNYSVDCAMGRGGGGPGSGGGGRHRIRSWASRRIRG